MLGQPPGDVRDREHQGLGGGGPVELVPVERGGDGRARTGADGVGGGGGLLRRVLGPVHQHPADPAGLRHGVHHQLGVGPFEFGGDGLRVRGDVLARGGADRHQQVQALRSRGLHPGGEAVGGEALAQQAGDGATRQDVGAVARVEVEDDPVGHRRLGGVPLRHVEFDAAEVRRPDERGGVVHDHLPQAPRGAGHRDGAHPPRGAGRRALREEPVAVHPLGAAQERQRPVVQVGQQRGLHLRVVPDDLTLERPGLREVHLVQVRQGQPASLDHGHRHACHPLPPTPVVSACGPGGPPWRRPSGCTCCARGLRPS